MVNTPKINIINCMKDFDISVLWCNSGIKSEPAIYIKPPAVNGINAFVKPLICSPIWSAINAPKKETNAPKIFTSKAYLTESPPLINIEKSLIS